MDVTSHLEAVNVVIDQIACMCWLILHHKTQQNTQVEGVLTLYQTTKF